MHRKDVLVDIPGQIEHPHGGVEGTDHRLTTKTPQTTGHRQRPIGIGFVIQTHQLNRAPENAARTVELLRGQ